MQFIINLLDHYGYIVLFMSLMLELIALPLPGGLLMTYTGFLVAQQKLNFVLSIFAAVLGAITGITISYFIGRVLGDKFFKKYGHYIHLGPKNLEKMSNWFDRYGNKLLIVAYFIPGVRHIAGYFSGITKESYKKFAVNAYLGAFIWVGTFISLGKIFGKNWGKYHGLMKKYSLIASVIIAIVITVVYLYKNYKLTIIEFALNLLNRGIHIFHSLGRIKIAVAGAALVCLGLSIVVIGIIQDFLANEYSEFDNFVSLLMWNAFSKDWEYIMRLFDNITSYKVLIFLTILLFIWILIKGADKFLETRFTLLIVLGGEALQVLLRFAFRRLGPSGNALIEINKYTFPSKESLMATVAYGFFAFMIIRHGKKAWERTVSVVIALIICILAGLSPLFFQIEYASDVFAGYIFGGVWLTLNIVLLEVYRIVPSIKE